MTAMTAGGGAPDEDPRPGVAAVRLPRDRLDRAGAPRLPGEHLRAADAGPGDVPRELLHVLLRARHRRDPHRLVRHGQPVRGRVRAARGADRPRPGVDEGAGGRRPPAEADGDLQRLLEGVREGDRRPRRAGGRARPGRDRPRARRWRRERRRRAPDRRRRARRRRGDRRPAGVARPGGPGSPRAAGRARGEHRRPDDRAVQGLPDDGLRELHHDAEDVGHRAQRGRDVADAHRRPVDRRRRGRRLRGDPGPSPALRGRGRLHRVPALRVRVPRRRSARVRRRPGRPPRRLHPVRHRDPAEGGDRPRRTASCAASARRPVPPTRSTSCRSPRRSGCTPGPWSSPRATGRPRRTPSASTRAGRPRT